jgi:hypothetical protein
MANTKLGDSSKIVSVTPKFYIKDDGTDYTTGEGYNGLWSTGEESNPGGYAGGGHWKINESEGNILYNNRSRGNNDLYITGFSRSTDAIGTYVQFNLPGNNPLASPNSSYYCMMGATSAKATSAITENLQFSSWLTTPGLGGGSTGAPFLRTETNHAELKFMFDFWAYFRKGPSTNGNYQTYLYLANEGSGSGKDSVMRFYLFNNGGSPELRLTFADNTAASRGTLNDVVISTSAGEALYPSGLSAEGGLHHIGLVFNRSNFSNFGTANGPDGFYIDGKYHPCSSLTGVSSWYTGSSLEVNVNPILFCQISSDNPTWTNTKATGDPRFNKHFTGKIYHASISTMNNNGEITASRMKTLNSLKFDIPRGPSRVDFSDRYEYKGRNLLQQLSTLKQKIESSTGTFTISVSSIKARN